MTNFEAILASTPYSFSAWILLNRHKSGSEWRDRLQTYKAGGLSGRDKDRRFKQLCSQATRLCKIQADRQDLCQAGQNYRGSLQNTYGHPDDNKH